MKRPTVLAAGLLAAGGMVALLTAATFEPRLAHAEEETVSAAPIATFMSAGIGERVQALIWRGGLELRGSTDTFGGLSGLGFTSDDGRLVMVSDRGRFISGQLIYDEFQQPLSLVGVTIEPIQNSRGAALPRPYTRDAEAIAVILREGEAAAVRVGF